VIHHQRELRNVARSYAAAAHGTPAEVHLRVKLDELVAAVADHCDPQNEAAAEFRRTAQELTKESDRLRALAKLLEQYAGGIESQANDNEGRP
jgi:hypothetical protein